MKSIPIYSVALLLMFGGQAQAKPRFMSEGYLSGHDLVRACHATLSRADKIKKKGSRSLSYFCSGYVLGYSSAEAVLQADSDIYGLYQKAFCLPEDISQLEIVRGVHGALKQYAGKRLDQPVSLLMKPAFIDAFPCSESEAQPYVVKQSPVPSSETLIGEPPHVGHIVDASAASSAWSK